MTCLLSVLNNKFPCGLNLNFRSGSRQLVAHLAQLFLEINQRFTAETFNVKQSFFAVFKFGKYITNIDNTGDLEDTSAAVAVIGMTLPEVSTGV